MGVSRAHQLTLVLLASLQESGGRPVTRRSVQAVWPAEKTASGASTLLNLHRLMITAQINQISLIVDAALAEAFPVFMVAFGHVRRRQPALQPVQGRCPG